MGLISHQKCFLGQNKTKCPRPSLFWSGDFSLRLNLIKVILYYSFKTMSDWSNNYTASLKALQQVQKYWWWSLEHENICLKESWSMKYIIRVCQYQMTGVFYPIASSVFWPTEEKMVDSIRTLHEALGTLFGKWYNFSK